MGFLPGPDDPLEEIYVRLHRNFREHQQDAKAESVLALEDAADCLIEARRFDTALRIADLLEEIGASRAAENLRKRIRHLRSTLSLSLLTESQEKLTVRPKGS